MFLSMFGSFLPGLGAIGSTIMDFTEEGVYGSPFSEGGIVSRTPGAFVGADFTLPRGVAGAGAGAEDGADLTPLRGVLGTPMFTHFYIESGMISYVRIPTWTVRSDDLGHLPNCRLSHHTT